MSCSESDSENDSRSVDSEFARSDSSSSSGGMSPTEAWHRRVLEQIVPLARIERRGRPVPPNTAATASRALSGSSGPPRGVTASVATPRAAAAAAPLSAVERATAAAHAARAAAPTSSPAGRASSSRASAQRASAAISEAASPHHARTANYPPAASFECAGSPAQIYRRDDWEYGLTTNSQLLFTNVQVSSVLPDGLAGLGLFASRSFAEGETIGFVWGKFVTVEDWEAILQRGCDNTYVQGEENYVIPAQRGIHRALSVPMLSNGASLLLVSEQCPIAYINQGHGAPTNNVELQHPEYVFDADCPRSTAYQYMALRAVVRTADGRGVQRGAREEFTTCYNWNPRNLQEMKESYAAYLNQLNKTKVGHLRGMYDCLRAQRLQPTLGVSSVVSLPSDDSSQSSSSSAQSELKKRRAALEQHDRLIDGEAGSQYSCCKKRCFSHTTHTWVTRTRSVVE